MKIEFTGNCRNCAAPLRMDKTACEHCGTNYKITINKPLFGGRAEPLRKPPENLTAFDEVLLAILGAFILLPPQKKMKVQPYIKLKSNKRINRANNRFIIILFIVIILIILFDIQRG